MKKLNFAIFGACLLTALATRALAETTIPWTKAGCESVKGTWITAHSPTDDGCDAAHCNGRNFCMSPTGRINWFSALIWCKSIGRELTSFDHACPGIPTGDGPCANLNLNRCQNGWTSMPSGSSKVFIARLKGNIHAVSRMGDGDGYACVNYALCE